MMAGLFYIEKELSYAIYLIKAKEGFPTFYGTTIENLLLLSPKNQPKEK